MNHCVLTGRLVRNAIVNGNQSKAMKFTLATKYGYDAKNREDRVAFVPCVFFDPHQELERILTEDGKGVFVELAGRVHQAVFEKDGKTTYRTEVVVDPRTFTLVATMKGKGRSREQ